MSKSTNLPGAEDSEKSLKTLSRQEVMERREWRNKIIATLPDPNAAGASIENREHRLEAIREQAAKNDAAIAEHMAKFGK